MTLSLIGIGLHDENDITLRGLALVKAADIVYLEVYTSLLQVQKEKLEQLYGKTIIPADRAMLEQQGDMMVEEAKKKRVALLVIGDVFSATTHADIYQRALEQNVQVQIVHNASIMTAIGSTGLSLYKFGHTTSIPFPADNWKVETFYDVLQQNQASGLHTLLLLDIQPPKFMTIKEAITALLAVEARRKERVFGEDMLCVGVARLGSPDQLIRVGTARLLLEKEFGKPLHALIVPGKLNVFEEEFLAHWV